MSTALLVLILGTSQLPGEPCPPENPPILYSDLRWFPPRQIAEANLKLAEQHIAWLLLMRDANMNRKEEWEEWIEDARKSRQPWCNLLNAHSYYEPSARWYLLCLRMRIGNANYYAGKMPPCLPIHRFREIR